jgi:hypothetical protein
MPPVYTAVRLYGVAQSAADAEVIGRIVNAAAAIETPSVATKVRTRFLDMGTFRAVGAEARA